MITGYNTDVRYGDLVLHVQTEDKGTSNPYLESLIYYGGQVVAAKRSNYANLVEEGEGKEAVTSLMEHQHRTMIKAIQAGRFDDKIRLFVGEKTKFAHTQPQPSPGTDVFEVSEEGGRTLDQVILEYLSNEAEQDQLVLVLEDDAELKAGSQSHLALRTRSSRSGQAISGAKVNVRMISTFGGPRTLGLGETDDDGFLQLPIEIPVVDHGTAALIVTAAAPLGQAELKYLL